MAIKSRGTLKSLFESGDTPKENDYIDFLDSFLNLADVTAQTITSDIITPAIRVNTVSALDVYTSALFASSISFSTLSAVNANLTLLSAPTINVNTISAANIGVGNLSAATIRHNNPIAHAEFRATNLNARNPASALSLLSANVSGNLLNNFTVTTAGRVTYTGSNSGRFLINYSFTVNFDNDVSGGVVSLLMKNSAQIAGSRSNFLVSDDFASTQSNSVISTLVCGDFIEIATCAPNILSANYNIQGFSIVTTPVGNF